MRVLVCGGRSFDNYEAVEKYLDMLNSLHRFTLLIHGGAQGADTCAARWARSRHIDVRPYPAMWGAHGRAAGHIRNGQMLREGQPDMVVAFPGGRGTRNMLKQSSWVPNLKIVNLSLAATRAEVEEQWRILDRSRRSPTTEACPLR
ncbi:DUF2493 domain-containing protein [Bradyrhizobium ottawaense]|uniref:DUF2493 domain-containing protein n=1 Tax=Bradyrhizobium ottawaense TaxID=931866 RepID=UPI0030F3A4DE